MTHPAGDTLAPDSLVVARLPVVDSSREIVGFELLNRAALHATARAELGGDEAVVTVSGLLGSAEVNLTALVGDKVLFCTVDRDVILGATRLTLTPRRTVLEVPADHVDDEFLAALRSYKDEGFTILVRHQVWSESTLGLLSLADLVKIHVGAGEPGDVMDVVHNYANVPVRLMAEGCDTEAALSWAQAIGFHYFVGDAVRAPETSSQDVSAPLPVSQVQLSVELLEADLDFDRVEDILRGDPALVAQLLTMASAGAAGGLRREVRTLREALVVMGTVRLRQWAALVILSRHSDRRTDTLVTTLVRARMCELLARSQGLDAPFAFTAGLLSALDVLLGVSTADVERQIHVGQELADAAFRHEGPVGRLVGRVEEYERWVADDGPTLEDHDRVTLIGAMAFSWGASYVQTMESAAQ